MPLLKPNGPDYESLEFKRSPAYTDYRAAMQAVGCASYAEVLACFCTDRARFHRFHDEWTARMQARVSARMTDVAIVDAAPVVAPGQTTREKVAALHAEGLSDVEMGQRIGVTASAVQLHRAALGLPANGAHARNKALAEAMREHLATGRSDADIAAALGVAHRRVADVRRVHCRVTRRTLTLSPAQVEARRRALALREAGATFADIAAALETEVANAYRWVRDARARAHHSTNQAA